MSLSNSPWNSKVTLLSCESAGEFRKIWPGESGKTEIARRSGLFVVAEVEAGVHLLRVQESHEQLG